METEDNYYTGNINILNTGEHKLISIEKKPENEWVEIAKKTKTAKVFLEFAKHPHLEVYQKDDNWVVEWDDLTFGFFRRKGFLAQVTISEDKKIISESFRF